MNLHASEERGVAVHIGPEDALVLRGVERNSVNRYIDSGVRSSADAQVAGTCAQSVVRPGEYAGSVGEEERQFLHAAGELLKLPALDPGDGERCALRGAGCTDHGFVELLEGCGIFLCFSCFDVCCRSCVSAECA